MSEKYEQFEQLIETGWGLDNRLTVSADFTSSVSTFEEDI